MVSVGQVVPHEVIGMANYSKNLVIGLGGAATINRSHFLGAVCGMERIMGRPLGPVRDVVDAAFDRFVARRVEVLWILTVVEDAPDGTVQRGLFVGRGGSGASGGAAYRAAAALAAACNIDIVDEPVGRVACWLDPVEFRSTWLANKAIYRTRMAIADGGELVVLAPGVSRFGEDPSLDALIRRHGYHGTAATLDALASDPELADNLGAAAHLIHSSSEGRFSITYCTDPSTGGLRARRSSAPGTTGVRSRRSSSASASRQRRRRAGERTGGARSSTSRTPPSASGWRGLEPAELRPIHDQLRYRDRIVPLDVAILARHPAALPFGARALAVPLERTRGAVFPVERRPRYEGRKTSRSILWSAQTPSTTMMPRGRTTLGCSHRSPQPPGIPPVLG